VTPTEASALSVAAALGVGYLYGGVTRRAIHESLERTAALTGTIFMVMAAAACAGWIGSLEQWPQRIGAFVTDSGLSGAQFLLMVNVFFLIAGMFMDAPMILALLVPLFGPAIAAQGINPIHMGLVICLNLTIGMITPPVGAILVVVSAVSGENYWTLARAVFPFLVVEVVILLLLTFVPSLTLFLPRLMGLA
jgi:tripartite ATP-independent transporter DctM subunit